MSKFLKLLLAVIFPLSLFAQTQDEIHVYGPGGPYPPIKEIAEKFSKLYGVKVIVTKGPTDNWIESAKRDADIIYSGSEFMMQNFVWFMEGKIDEKTVRPLYIRPSGILVRKGNPKNIKKFEDLLKPGIKILVVNGAGQLGLWEDMALKQGDIKTLKMLRKNIVYYAHNSAEAKKKWIQDPSIDAWITWNIWQISNPELSDFVPVSDRYVIYRGSDVALTFKGEKSPVAIKFYNFLFSRDAEEIFKKWGWLVK